VTTAPIWSRSVIGTVFSGSSAIAPLLMTHRGGRSAGTTIGALAPMNEAMAATLRRRRRRAACVSGIRRGAREVAGRGRVGGQAAPDPGRDDAPSPSHRDASPWVRAHRCRNDGLLRRACGHSRSIR
jgi:hypothetical protein